jgi:hypothetical protein
MEIMEYLFDLDPKKHDEICIERGIERVPNGAVMIFECTDGHYSLQQIPGLEDLSIDDLRRS